MFEQKDVDLIKRYFSIFSPVPHLEIDHQNSETEAYILINKASVSIGKHFGLIPSIGNIEGNYYTVHDYHGEEIHRSNYLDDAILKAMLVFAEQKYLSINDQIYTEQYAKDFA